VTTDGLDAWAVLGDPTRRTIVERLSARPSSVAELADELPVSRPAVSQHLQLLKRVGLVHDRAAGTRRIYSVDAERLAEFRRELDDFWGAALRNLADRPPRPTTTEESP
jgi:DNA-binding transcriptional ArsR family regulator